MEGVFLPSSVTTIGADAFKNALKAGDREVRYEVEGDDERLKTLLTGSGYPDVNSLKFRLYCKLTVTPNNKKYGTAGVIDDDTLETTIWAYAEEDELMLQAKSKKGYVFAGWYQDKACKTPIEDSDILDGDYRMARIPIVMPAEHATYYAKFITKAADKKALKFSAATKKLAKTTTKLTPESCNPIKITAVAGSRITYSAKGVPTGLYIDEETGEIKGSPRKPGTFTATITVKTAGGNKITQKIKMSVEAYSGVWGVYKGYARFKATDPAANLTFSIQSKGQVTGKVIFKDKSYSFTSQLSYSTPSFSEFSPSIKIGKTTYKPGKVTIYEFENLATTVEAEASGEMEFCAYKQPHLIVANGPLADAAQMMAELKDEASAAYLTATFKLGDTVLVTGTIGGKPVNFSSQLSLKGSYNNGSSDCYDLVTPVVLYKYGFYRTLFFTLIKNGSSISVDVKEIRELSEMIY
jgi:uncharacterized repeat protein (TIGR02543 family)